MNETSEKLRIFNLLGENKSWLEILITAIKLEKDLEKEYQEKGYGPPPGWQWYQIHCAVPTLNRMVAEKLLDITLSTNRSNFFKVHNPEFITEVIEFFQKEDEGPKEVIKEIPDDLFANIVEYENIKTLLKLAIEAESPCHVLLTGAVASAKTMFLLELNRLGGSYYALAPTLTEAGLSSLLFIYQPKILIVDECDRLPASEIGVLNSLMATGRIVTTKYNKTRSVELKTKVFAAGIRINKLPQDLLSRFIKLKFPSYSEDDFIRVATTVLVTREAIIPERAEEIARVIWQMYGEQSDIRQAVSVARLSAGDSSKIKEVLSTIKKYANGGASYGRY